MAALSIQDMAGLVGILASAADPNSEASLDARRRTLFSAVAAFIEADAWVWTSMRTDGAPAAESAQQKLHNGWADDRQRDAAFAALGQCPLQQLLAAAPVGATPDCGITRTRKDLNAASPGRTENGENAWQAVGVGDFMISLYPLDGATYSAVGYCRRTAQKLFTDRDRSVLHLIFQHVSWLHTDAPTQGGSSPTSALSPREKEVLSLLLEGHARKEVAARLQLSAHTVADYLKVIYKKLGVSSRAELLAKFIHNS